VCGESFFKNRFANFSAVNSSGLIGGKGEAQRRYKYTPLIGTLINTFVVDRSSLLSRRGIVVYLCAAPPTFSDVNASCSRRSRRGFD